MFVGLSPVDTQKHLVAQVALGVEPVDTLESRRLLAFGSAASLEMLRLTRFNLQEIV